MGVPGFFSWLIKNKKKLKTNNLIINEIPEKIKYLMLDTNCLLHPCVNNIIEKYKSGKLNINKNKPLRDQLEEYIWNKIEDYINDIIRKVNPEYLIIAIDGVAPMGKILQQRQRRYKYLYDKKIKLNSINNDIIDSILQDNGIELPKIPISSIELTPGTDYMERIHNNMEEYVKKLGNKIKVIYSSYHEEGEGEHKILQYIKRKLTTKDTIVIYGLDADLLFLSLGIGYEHNLYIMREKQIFNNKEVDLDADIEYNYVEIKKLHKMILNLEINTNDFILICYLIGNDFLPNLLTTDVKKNGLDKICSAYENMISKLKLSKVDKFGNIVSHLINYNESNINKFSINDDLLIELFRELLWTEKYIWKNINRDRYLNPDVDSITEIELKKIEREEQKKETLNKFVLGLTFNTDFIEKIEFNSDIEYYSYYLGINCLDIDKSIIKKMVNDYITGITWCINYYLDDCKSWSWGYNFLVAPLIKDIIHFYPKKIEIENLNRNLNPVEQLILAIPPDTYKYVIETDIINKLKHEKTIGYMFPESFDIDVNKEMIYWKCPVKIPIVEYSEYIHVIKKLNINNKKNIISNNLFI